MKKKPKYQVGVIGCGMIFTRHIESIESRPDDFELVALCDIDKPKLDLRSKEYQVPGFTDYKKMLKQMKGKMNFVVVATPNSLHFQQAMDSLRSGYNILVEKPIDFKHKRILEISDQAKKIKREAFAVLQVRYNPTIGMVREALDGKILGDIRSVSLIQRWQRPPSYFDSWRADLEIGGRTLYEVGIHYLDIMQLLFGVPKVFGSSTFNNKHKHVEFEDTVFSILQFPCGASGSLEVTIASEPSNLECSLSVMGSLGYLKVGGRALDEIERAMFLRSDLDKRWKKLVEGFGNSLEPNSYGTHAGSCPNHPTLYAEIAEGRGIKLEEAVESVRFIEAVYDKEINGKKKKK